MNKIVQLFLELEVIEGRHPEFEEATRAVMEIVRTKGIPVSLNFYSDPGRPSIVYAIETYDSAETLGRYFQMAGAALQRARACSHPRKVVMMGDLPTEMRAMLEGDGATVAPPWLRNH
jgi:hypothetical protein